MNKKTSLKYIILYSAILIVSILAIYIYFEPLQIYHSGFINKKIDKITSAQNIAPQRLYINTWRTVKNEYVDPSMNNQNWLRWRNKYSKHIKTMDDAHVAINTMLSSLNDPYTKFLKTEIYSKQQEILDSQITGIGIILNKTGENITINHVLDNSPAQKGQIQVGDTILSVNGKDVKSANIDTLINKTKNDKEQDIKITLKRNGKIIEKTVKKAKIPIKTMQYNFIDKDIALITLATIMGKDTIKDFKTAIDETNNAKGIIIDLRDNYGGILSNAIEMANYMLFDEEIVSIESSKRKLHIFASEETIFKKKPIVILVNKKTASAAEVLAGSLKDNLGAIIIGESTYGKNSIQQIIPMANKTGLIITASKYILPKGEDIHNTGIKPDYITKKDEQFELAIKIIKDMTKNVL